MGEFTKDKQVNARITSADKEFMKRMNLSASDVFQAGLKAYKDGDEYYRVKLENAEKELEHIEAEELQLKSTIKCCKEHLGFMIYTNREGEEIELNPYEVSVVESYLKKYRLSGMSKIY